MRFDDVAAVLDALDDAGIRYWVGGGWGVDILVGRQTREHRDLDLGVDDAEFDACLRALADLGYIRETDWLPVRVELKADGERWADVHPIQFDGAGHGRQAGLGGAHFDYPPEAFTTGTLRGRAINCLSVEQQRKFHAGYEHQDKDRHDLLQLDAVGD
jgi:lincosamide nucleotidyltransferase A/C/D/E